SEPLHQRTRVLRLLVDRKPKAKSELGIILKERVRPRRPAALGILRPRRGGEIAAVDRGAAGGIGDQQPVTKELRQQLEVRRFTAAGAGAGELEQRPAELRVFHQAEVQLGTVDFRQPQEEVPVLTLLLAQRWLWRHCNRLA